MMAGMKWPQVFLFGDSLTQQSFSPPGCWGSLIADQLQRKCDVVNRGLSGYNTRYCQYALPKFLTKEHADNIVALVIFLGANDSTIETARQHVPIEEYQENLLKMINYAKSTGVCTDKMLLVGPPPCVEEKWAQGCVVRGIPMTKDNSLVGGYSKACETAAQLCGLDYVELYHRMMREENWQMFLGDGLHFSKEGSEFLYSQLWPHIDKRTSHLQMIFPYWADINIDNPQSSFQ